jgi:O-antigen ligase
MKELLLIKDSLANKISYYHLLLFMASLPFNQFYSHIILISFTLHTLIQYSRAHIKPGFTWRMIVLQLVFWVTAITTIYSINFPEAFNEWGRQVPILLIPALFCFTGLDLRQYRSRLLLAFSLVCTATIAYLYLDALITIRHYHLPLKTIFSATFTNHNFSEPIDIHATFFSLQVAVALVYILSVLIKERSTYYRLFYLICAGILLAGIIQLCSKSVFVVLFFIINLAIPLFLLADANRFKFMAATLFISVLAIGGILTLSTLRTRYISDLKTDLVHTATHKLTDSRWDRWSVATALIVKAPVIGHGAGSEISLLHEGFFIKKYYNSFLNRLNAHNEYLSFLIKSGIIGLLVYLYVLSFGFRVSLQKKDLLFFTFMLLVALVSFSENVLDVDKGVLFYAFFFSFFMFTAGDTVDTKKAM